jgi:recombinational DNA repair protein (RecF pathway)
MQHKYRTEALVLGRYPIKEHDAQVVLATEDFGVIRARVGGLRKSGSKMAAGLQTLAESNVALIRAKDGWRLAGAVVCTHWAEALPRAARSRFARLAELTQRLSHGEESEPRVYAELIAFARALSQLSEEAQDAAECLAALRILHILGHDAGELPGGFADYSETALTPFADDRKSYIARVNHGISVSGL